MNTTKPTLVHVIAWTTLTSGIVNLFWGFAASATAIATLIGIVCVPLTILPTVLGVFELIYAAKLFSNPPQAVKPSTNIAVLEIACALTGNFFAVAVGILSLVFYNDAAVKEYFVRLNEPFRLTPPPPPSPLPASLLDPQLVVPTLVEEAPTPPEEPPAKPKRVPRKVSKK